MIPTISGYFDSARRNKLRKAYKSAVNMNLEQFNFEGNELLTRYAKYLLEYLDMQLNKSPAE